MDNYPDLSQGTLTMIASGTIVAGNAVKVIGNDTVAAVADGNDIFSVAKKVETDGYVTVQIGGVLEFTYSGTAPTVGRGELLGAASGAVRIPGAEEAGRACDILSVDTTNSLVAVVF